MWATIALEETVGNAVEGGKECATVRIRSVYGGEFAEALPD